MSDTEADWYQRYGSWDDEAIKKLSKKSVEFAKEATGQNTKKVTPPPEKTGPRGGRYTEAITKDGRRYRRYF